MQTRRVARIDQRDWVGEDALARLTRVACHPHVVTRLLRESAFGPLAASPAQDANTITGVAPSAGQASVKKVSVK